MSDSIYIKSKSEIELMRQAGRITAGARSIARGRGRRTFSLRCSS